MMKNHFDLHMFTGNTTNGIVTVNGYHNQYLFLFFYEDHYLIFALGLSVHVDFDQVFQQYIIDTIFKPFYSHLEHFIKRK